RPDLLVVHALGLHGLNGGSHRSAPFTIRFARTSSHTSTEYATSGSRGSGRFQLPRHAVRMSRAASLSASACHLAFSAASQRSLNGSRPGSLRSSVIGPPRVWRRFRATLAAGTSG